MNADEQHLLESGWYQTNDTWLHKDMKYKKYGYTFKEALEKQKGLETIAKIGAFYFYTHNSFGYGYRVGYYINVFDVPFNGHFIDHLDKETAQKLVKRLNSGEKELIPGIDYIKHKYNNILILKEKHRERYFYVSTLEDLQKAALNIVLERHQENYWYDFSSEEPKKPKVKLEDADTFGENIGTAVKNEWENYDYKIKQHNQNIQLQKALDKIVKDKDASLALRFLNEMKDGEYEGFEVVEAESIEEI